jgi:hypothetical protein
MKKTILLAFIGLMFSNVAKSAGPSVYTITSTTVTISSNITQSGWNALFSLTSGDGTTGPFTYSIAPSATIIIGAGAGSTVLVDLTAVPNVTIVVSGNLGFFQGQKNLKLSASSNINVKSGGQVGFAKIDFGKCCFGNDASNITIGTGAALKGGFNFEGPVNIDTSNYLASGNSTSWTGVTSSVWNLASNWTRAVPTNTVNVIIPVTTNNPIISSAVNPSIKRLYVNSGALLTINSGASLTTNDSLVNTGTITVKSGGSLVQAPFTYLRTGANGIYNIERTVPGSASFISSPISDIAVNGFGITPTGSNGGQIVPSPNGCISASISATSPYGNLLEMRENATLATNCSQELWFVKSSGTLTNGRGYALTDPTTNLNFTGTLINNGFVTYSALTSTTRTITTPTGTATGGWHIVGNPYPSPISINGTDLTSMNGSGIGFDGQIQLYTNGIWFPINPVTTTTIAVGQGFQIRNSTGSPQDFGLDNSFRCVANPTFRSSHDPMPPPEHHLSLLLSNGTSIDSSMIYFYEGATDAYDRRFDANRLDNGGNSPLIYSLANDEHLAYNALALMNPGETKTVPLGISLSNQGTHSLTFKDANTLGANLVLLDNKLNTEKVINEGSVYNFTPVGNDNLRFALRFATDASPIALSVSTLQDANVKLFPNPTSGTTSLVLGVAHSYNKATVTDVFGRVVQTYELIASDTSKLLNTDELSTGVYLIKLVGTNNQTVFKLIKQ